MKLLEKIEEYFKMQKEIVDELMPYAKHAAGYEKGCAYPEITRFQLDPVRQTLCLSVYENFGHNDKVYGTYSFPYSVFSSKKWKQAIEKMIDEKVALEKRKRQEEEREREERRKNERRMQWEMLKEEFGEK